MVNFNNCEDYIPFKEPIDFGKFEATGYFPYETAQISNFREVATPPRALMSHIEDVLRRNNINDNKYVVIFRDKERFGTDDFAIQFKDAFCKIGSLDSVLGYGVRELRRKKAKTQLVFDPVSDSSASITEL